MPTRTRWSVPIQPDELKLLGEVFETALTERKCSRESELANALAVKIINLYQSGVRDPERLNQLIREF